MSVFDFADQRSPATVAKPQLPIFLRAVLLFPLGVRSLSIRLLRRGS